MKREKDDGRGGYRKMMQIHKGMWMENWFWLRMEWIIRIIWVRVFRMGEDMGIG